MDARSSCPRQIRRVGLSQIDFLYAGAQVGERYADVTGMEAFHIGMEYLKEAADDAFFSLRGAPMLPSLGYADAFRTGADICS